jgi:hypothetical protein
MKLIQNPVDLFIDVPRIMKWRSNRLKDKVDAVLVIHTLYAPMPKR